MSLLQEHPETLRPVKQPFLQQCNVNVVEAKFKLKQAKHWLKAKTIQNVR